MNLDREAVVAAAQRIAGQVERTALIEAELGGRRFWLKAECQQTGGSFKLRGASNRMLALDEAERRAGVVAFSSGNHAQGVAIAAARLGIRATIVMPADAPELKVAGTRAQGAEVVFYDRAAQDRVEIARRLADERGAVVVPSFDDPHIVAGQGTAGLEIAEQCPEPVRRILVCTGGGGLAAGIALAVPEAEIVCVEPQGWDDMGRSLEAGAIRPVAPNPPPTLCDALQTPLVSPITFGILHARGARGVSVSEEEVKVAVGWAWEELQLVVEPGGAVALAALLAGRVPLERGTVATLSGSNIDPQIHQQILGETQAEGRVRRLPSDTRPG